MFSCWFYALVAFFFLSMLPHPSFGSDSETACLRLIADLSGRQPFYLVDEIPEKSVESLLTELRSIQDTLTRSLADDNLRLDNGDLGEQPQDRLSWWDWWWGRGNPPETPLQERIVSTESKLSLVHRTIEQFERLERSRRNLQERHREQGSLVGTFDDYVFEWLWQQLAHDATGFLPTFRHSGPIDEVVHREISDKLTAMTAKVTELSSFLLDPGAIQMRNPLLDEFLAAAKRRKIEQIRALSGALLDEAVIARIFEAGIQTGVDIEELVRKEIDAGTKN